MMLFVGLGNPGPRYANHRHNIGFMAVDAIRSEFNFSPERKRFQGLAAEGLVDGGKVLILKPETFMNESGRAVREAAQFYKLDVSDIFVFHDELDLAPGKIRVKTGGGVAGHNGLRSIAAHMGPDFHRVRMGIGHPGSKDAVTAYVLNDFSKAEHDWLDPLIEAAAKEAGWLAQKEPERFMTAVSLRLPPPKSAAGKNTQQD